jgi:hypothetical protein
MTREGIIDNQGKILECARSFRDDANYLMYGLANDFSFSLAKPISFPKEVYKSKYNNKGIFRNDWTYWFHGAECVFENTRTGQVVELIWVTTPEFGFLDGYFFYNYMLTTERYKELAKWFESYSNVWEAIDRLAEIEILYNVPTAGIARNVIAL